MRACRGLLLWALLASGCRAGPIEILEDRLLQGLVAHWTFDEASGSLAADSSGHGYDGAVTGATWVSGHFNGALHFEQESDLVAVPSFPQATTDWTVALWARPSTGTFVNQDYGTLVSNEALLAGGWEMNAALPGTNDFYQFGYYVGAGQYNYLLYDCSGVVREQWTHLAAVVRGAKGTISIYRDSLYQGQATLSSAAGSGLIRTGLQSLYIGQWHGMDRGFKGDIDDILIYDRALSNDEISALARPAGDASP
jgi:hypothetical protein